MTKLQSQRGKMANSRKTNVTRLIPNSDGLSSSQLLSCPCPAAHQDIMEDDSISTLRNPEIYLLRRKKGTRLRYNLIPRTNMPLLSVLSLLLLSISVTVMGDAGVGNNWERPLNMPRIQGLEVMCGAQHMEVHLNFDLPFHGLVASKGMYGQPECVYVQPRSGHTKFVFNINYEKCGTKPDNHGKFYENTVVVQYDEELIEAWDEAKRLRCEWFNDYEKTATKTNPMVISDLEIVELNFHGDNVDCWMEIQNGRGPWAPPLNGIVPLGSTLTMVIAVKDPTGEFDMRVKACEASDGQNGHVLPLSDAEGCILRPKLIGKFSKVKLDDGRATVLTYAFLSAFKFPDMLNVHMRCTVEICRHGCPDHCYSREAAAASNQAKNTAHPNEIQGAHSLQEPLAYESQQHKVVASPNDIPRATPKSLPLHENVVDSSSPTPPSEQESSNNENSIQKQPGNSPNPVSSEILDNIREHINNHQEEKQQQLPQQQQPPPPQQQHPENQQQQPPHPHQPQLGPQPGFSANNIPLMSPPPPPHHLHHSIPIRNGPPPPPPGMGRPGPGPGHPLPGFFAPGQQRFPVHSSRYPPPPQSHPGKFRPPPPPPHMRHGPPPPQRQQNGIPVMHFQQQPQPQQMHPHHNDGRLHHRVDTIPEHIAMPRMGEADVGNSEEVPRGLSTASSNNNNNNNQNVEKQPEVEGADKQQQPQAQQPQPQAEPLKGEPSASGDSQPEITSSVFPKGPRKLRMARSVVSPSSNNGIIGIEGTFKVVSEADLNFALNSNSSNSPATVVLKGSRMLRDGDPIYGICLPRFGFGIVFFGLGLATLVAILIAVFLAYAHYIVKSSNRKNLEGHPPNVGLGMAHHPPAFQHHGNTPARHENVLPLIILRKMW